MVEARSSASGEAPTGPCAGGWATTRCGRRIKRVLHHRLRRPGGPSRGGSDRPEVAQEVVPARPHRTWAAARSRLRSGEGDENVNGVTGVVGCFGELQGVHGRKRGTPREETSGREPACSGEVLRACGDGLHVLGAPEQEVDRIEGRVTQAGRGVDGNQATLVAAVEDVRGGEVAVQENGSGCLTREVHRQLTSSLVQLG